MAHEVMIEQLGKPAVKKDVPYAACEKASLGMKKPYALDGSGCPSEAPYGCFLPDLTRFGTYRHPNPSSAHGAVVI